MSFDRWNEFVDDLRAKTGAGPFDVGQFTEFVKSLPEQERVPLLLHAYDRYRELNLCRPDPGDGFENSCYSILISSILAAGIQPNEIEALEILRKSYHRCGHGSDVAPPLELADRAFANRPYSQALFDAVAEYRETLRPATSTAANELKRKATWVLWHDPRRVEKKCCTGPIQQAIHAMDPPAAFAWQWLFRNAAGGLNSAPGKKWLKEGKKRLSQIGEAEFLRRLDQWLRFGEEETSLSPAGSVMLRLLVWYGSLVNVDRSLPLLARIAHVRWAKREPAQKAISALAWLLQSDDNRAFDAEISIICRDWSSDSSEVKRLQEGYRPGEAVARRQLESAAAEQSRKESAARLAGAVEQLYSRTGLPSFQMLIDALKKSQAK